MSDEGASPAEILVESCRRNNTELLEQVLAGVEDKAGFLNSATDPVGNSGLHLAAANGSYECLDIILDIEGVEVDPVNRMQGETPLHSAVRYSDEEPEHGAFIVEELIEAGCDPRIKNKDGLKPVDLANPKNEDLVNTLRGAELALNMGNIEETNAQTEDSAAEEGSESGSESD
ncbi:ankyrin [Nadsonia fulvescens var. elongata DSM 6958]|uniref:Ankyrin n=1 Tax=Nadsonia fulvescens var. elongata DSM 6958 TaxID=857566 RepID=A0A1E3PIW3_9ASCO|nr:ankyrin [Nadsonia fulvescens var. elongata DSM 6958]